MPTVWDNRIDHRFPCQCGYDLYSLPDKGECPECGAAYSVAQGRRRGWVRFTRDEWKTFFVIAGFVGTIQWIIRMFLLSWLAPPLYVVAAMPLVALEAVEWSMRMTGIDVLIIHLLVSVANSLLWGAAVAWPTMIVLRSSRATPME